MGSISAISYPRLSLSFLPKGISSNTIRSLPPSSLRRTTPTGNLIRYPNRIFVASAEGNSGDRSGKVREESDGVGGGGRRSPAALKFRWRDLLNPDPENIVAVGLAGLLTWASVNVLWQIFFISFAILLAALKYSFIAALLLFILITLL